MILGAVLIVAGSLRYRGKRTKVITWVAIASGALIAALGLYHQSNGSDGATVGLGIYATIVAGTFGFVGGVESRKEPAVAMGQNEAEAVSEHGPKPEGASGPPPEWYKDPDGGEALRWWDGTAYTEHRKDAP
jgi:hypothetical protein